VLFPGDIKKAATGRRYTGNGPGKKQSVKAISKLAIYSAGQNLLL
jgi:hypothetical protein